MRDSGKYHRSGCRLKVPSLRNTGKGVLFDLLEKTFGGYYGTLDSEFFTKTSRNSGQATPELADKKGKRIVLASEQDDNEKFQVKRIKLVSGGDEVSARMMRENPIYFRLFLLTSPPVGSICLSHRVTESQSHRVTESVEDFTH